MPIILNLSPVAGLSEPFFAEVPAAVVLVGTVVDAEVVTTGSLNVFFALISVCLSVSL